MSAQAQTKPLAERRAEKIRSAAHGSGSVKDTTMAGYPVPIYDGETLWYSTILFKRSGRPPKPPELFEPSHLARIDAETGERFQIVAREVSSTDPVGRRLVDPDLGMKGFKSAEGQLYAAITVLADLAREPGRPLSDREAQAVAAFRESWAQVGHHVLESYYKQLNPEWWAVVAAK